MMTEQVGNDCIVTVGEGTISLKDCNSWKLLNAYYDRQGWGKRYTDEEMEKFGFEKKKTGFSGFMLRREVLGERKTEMQEVLTVARTKRGQFCLEAMKNIDKYGYDFVEADSGDCLVYVKYANKEK